MLRLLDAFMSAVFLVPTFFFILENIFGFEYLECTDNLLTHGFIALAYIGLREGQKSSPPESHEKGT